RLSGATTKIEVWPTRTIQQMREELDALDSDWKAWLSAPKPSRLEDEVSYINTKGEQWSNTARDILMHVLLHSAYHRGQIATLLGQAGQGAAYTDFIHAIR